MKSEYSLVRKVWDNKGCVFMFKEENGCNDPQKWLETVWYCSKKPASQREETWPTFLLYSCIDVNISHWSFLTKTLKVGVGGSCVKSNQPNKYYLYNKYDGLLTFFFLLLWHWSSVFTGDQDPSWGRSQGSSYPICPYTVFSCPCPWNYQQGNFICLQCRRLGFDPWVRKILWRRNWQTTPVFLPGEFHG